MSPIALYVHIPFCRRKCDYCDFTSFADREDLIDRYIERLAREADDAVGRYGGLSLSSVFIGGGTPSIMSPEQIDSLFEAIRLRFAVESGAEITMECNPGTLTAEKLIAMRKSGVNRLSIGVQAFDNRLLRSLGRIHDADEALLAVSSAREAGFDNLSVDLMYALPGQSLADWENTLKTAVCLPLKHVSCYSLILEEGTPLWRRMSDDPSGLPDEETSVRMTRMADSLLTNAGFERYEISNWAKPGWESRHNLTYWRRGDYLGLGCAAHSLMRGKRFSNTESLNGYMAGDGPVEIQALTVRDVFEETVMLGLRTLEGIPFDTVSPEKAEPLIERGLLARDGGRIRVTSRGADVLNAIILELI